MSLPTFRPPAPRTTAVSSDASLSGDSRNVRPVSTPLDFFKLQAEKPKLLESPNVGPSELFSRKTASFSKPLFSLQSPALNNVTGPSPVPRFSGPSALPQASGTPLFPRKGEDIQRNHGLSKESESSLARGEDAIGIREGKFQGPNKENDTPATAGKLSLDGPLSLGLAREGGASSTRASKLELPKLKIKPPSSSGAPVRGNVAPVSLLGNLRSKVNTISMIKTTSSSNAFERSNTASDDPKPAWFSGLAKNRVQMPICASQLTSTPGTLGETVSDTPECMEIGRKEHHVNQSSAAETRSSTECFKNQVPQETYSETGKSSAENISTGQSSSGQFMHNCTNLREEEMGDVQAQLTPEPTERSSELFSAVQDETPGQGSENMPIKLALIGQNEERNEEYSSLTEMLLPIEDTEVKERDALAWLREMSDQLEAQHDKLKQMQVELYLLNNDVLLMNDPILFDRVSDLLSGIEGEKMDGFGTLGMMA